MFHLLTGFRSLASFLATWKGSTSGLLSIFEGKSQGSFCRILQAPFPWAVGFFFGDMELSMELWTTIAGISGFDD